MAAWSLPRIRSLTVPKLNVSSREVHQPQFDEPGALANMSTAALVANRAEPNEQLEQIC
jgi:hypothetical protein